MNVADVVCDEVPEVVREKVAVEVTVDVGEVVVVRVVVAVVVTDEVREVVGVVISHDANVPSTNESTAAERAAAVPSQFVSSPTNPPTLHLVAIDIVSYAKL